jgi:ABC-2 type transport system permease protein
MQGNGKLLLGQTWLLASREYRERVRSRAFVLVTLLTPLVLGGVLGGTALLAVHASASQRVAIVSDDLAEARDTAQELKQESGGPQSVEVLAPEGAGGQAAGEQAALNRRVEAKELNGYLLVTHGAAGQRAIYVSSSSADLQTGGMMEDALSRASTRMALRARGLSAADASALLQHVSVETEQVQGGRLMSRNNKRGFAGAYALVMLMYIVVLIYGMNVARSVVQEKTSRIYEVLLSTATADALILGKLLGVGAAGLTQVAIWFVLLGAVAGTSLAETYGLHGLGSLGIRPEQVVFFLVYFVLGFLFYSGISAGIGALLGAEQELQQFSFIIVAPLIVSVLMMNYVLSNPGAPISVAMSLIPPFTPIVMYLRICAGATPAWQIALSIVLLLGSIGLVVWLAARIYRVGILMYGKRPTLPEALRWLRAS